MMLLCIPRKKILLNLFLSLNILLPLFLKVTVFLSDKDITFDKDITISPFGKRAIFRFSLLSAEDESSPSSENYINKQQRRISTTSTNQDEIAIFYHGFITPKDPQQGHAVIAEQLDQIIQATERQHERRFNMHINLIGYSDNTTKALIDSKCERLHCIHIEQHASGFEELTLDQLTKYCESNLHKRVVYLHSKGTFHPKKYQAEWRRALTAAALEETCLHPPSPECNLCGLTFEPFWTMFIAGNMWTADCSYISKLYPIHQFSNRTIELKNHANELGYKPQFASQSLLERGDIHGLGRYALEHWVGTHPDVRPCVQATYTRVPLRVWHHREHTPQNFRWTMFPREDQSVETTEWTGNKEKKRFESVLRSRIQRWKEYQFLPGYILKWQTLYGKIPGNVSWVWDFYPDGPIWKAVLAVHGKDTLEKAIEIVQRRNKTTTYNQIVTRLKNFQNEIVQTANLQPQVTRIALGLDEKRSFLQ